jgi:transcription elongation factor Elf1
VEIVRDEGRAVVSCGNCGVKEEFQVKRALGEIDVFCMFTDKIYGSLKKPSVPEVKSPN